MGRATMLIGELARRLSVNPKTIRYYEQLGLMSPPARTPAGYRVYTEDDAERLAFILRARALDFSLEDIREILALRERGEVPCPYVVRQIEEKIRQVDRRIEELQRLKEELEALQAQAAEMSPEEIAAKGRICHILENRGMTESEHPSPRPQS